MQVRSNEVYRMYTHFNNQDEYEFILQLLQKRGFERQHGVRKNRTVVYKTASGKIAYAQTWKNYGGRILVFERERNNELSNV
jgi:hypothetical protein